MTRTERIIETLRANKRELQSLGVRHAALFGSAARGEERENSDVDIAVTFANTSEMKGAGYFGVYQSVMDRLEALLASEIDLTDESMMRPSVRPSFENDRIRAF